MACFKPLEAWQSGEKHPISGRRLPTFKSAEARKDLPRVKIPCGQCFGCRSKRKGAWAIRNVHESKQHDHSYFVTLTQDDDHIPPGGALDYTHVQAAFKRLRRRVGPFRHFTVGEYGENFLRPHYHSLMYGLVLPDARLVSQGGEQPRWESAILSEAWGRGFVYVGSVTPESIAYCSNYVVDKRTGPLAEVAYRRVDPDTGEVYQVPPEFARMSLRPGIGAGAFELWSDEWYHEDCIRARDGRPSPIPAYYDKLLTRRDAEYMETLKVARLAEAMLPANVWNSSPERLVVREEVARAKRKLYLKRTL